MSDPSNMKVKQIEGHSIEKLLNLAQDTVTKKTRDSKLLDSEAEERIPKFEASGKAARNRVFCFGGALLSCCVRSSSHVCTELNLGRVLGRGGFCVVTEVTKITLNNNATNGNSQHKIHDDDEDDHRFHNIVQDRNFMQANYLRGKGKDCRYAIKKLQDASFKDTTTFVNGVVDLAIEARYVY